MNAFIALICFTASPIGAIFLTPEAWFVTVQTPVGNIRGISKVRNGQTINVFHGIPYAEAPTGGLRFNKPVPRAPFRSTYDATNSSSAFACLSIVKQTLVSFSEDCLRLSVYVPDSASTRTEKKPVMIFIHGGGFYSGSSAQYDGSMLAGSDVIYVAINYRLAQLGFLSTESGMVEGNFGLWDQHMAIQWVHDNIESFGGNVNDVTIFGQSAGSSSVMYQSMYAGNKGLFQRVIAESGSTTSSWAYKNVKTSTQNAYRFANHCGCHQTTEDTMVACLRSLTSTEMANCLTTYTDGYSFDDLAWTVTADDDFVAVDQWRMFTDSDATRTDLTFFRSLDLLIGVNKGDGLVFLGDWMSRIQTNLTANPAVTTQQFRDNILPAYLKFGKDFGTVNPAFLEKVFSFYAEDASLAMLRNLVQFTTDICFTAPSVLALNAHNTHGVGRSYFYEFAYSPDVHFLPGIPAIDDGTLANHGAELHFIFGDAGTFTNPVEQRLAKTMVTMWTNFAKTG